MKSILLLFAVALSGRICGQLSIQLTNIATSATLAPNTVITATTTANGTTTHSIDFKNTSASTKTIIVKRYDVLLFSNITSTAIAVFNNLPPQTKTLSLQLNAGQSASQIPGPSFLVSEFYEADAVGHSIVKYTFYNTSTLSDSIQLTLNYNPPSGISELNSSVSNVELSPNPVNEITTIKINSLKTLEGKLFIYNSLGSVLKRESFSLDKGENRLNLNFATFPSGIYFVDLKFDERSITKKIIVN